MTCPNGDVYTYEYDANNNKTKETCPDGRAWTWEYLNTEEHLTVKIDGRQLVKIHKK